MLNQTTANQPQNQEALTLAFQDFNGVFRAKISNLKDKATFAYGETKETAQTNAVRNFQTKYATGNFQVFNN